MDGDSTDVEAVAELCQTYNAFFILDEAHAVGVMNKKGCQELSVPVFARVVTFGKAFGSHGAVILGAQELKDYLINFARSFIYTTAPSPETTARNWAAHLYLASSSKEYEALRTNIKTFKEQLEIRQLSSYFIKSDSAIQSCVLAGNQYLKSISKQLQQEGFDVKPILSPTVPKGKERLRFCLHSFNTEDEIKTVLATLAKYLNPN
jgi:8-amino-7-oxononanoate synthase